MHANKRWEGDVEWESGFSFFFLNLFFFFFPSHASLEAKSLADNEMACFEVCSPAVLPPRCLAVIRPRQGCWWGNCICCLWRTLQALPMCVAFKGEESKDDRLGPNKHLWPQRLGSPCRALWVVALHCCLEASMIYLPAYEAELCSMEAAVCASGKAALTFLDFCTPM